MKSLQTSPLYLACDLTVNASGSSKPIKLPNAESASFFLNVIGLSTGTPASSFQLYVQHSPDGGNTWLDFIAFNAATSAGYQVASWSHLASGGAPGLPIALGSGTLLPGSVLNGPIGRKAVRVLWRLSGASPTAEFSVYALCWRRR